MATYTQPRVPLSYFYETASPSDVLPLELLGTCLTEYADWGDLAKLACVQKSWSNIVQDTANADQQTKWELAQALMNGDCGLQKNAALALRLLTELANVVVDDKGTPTVAMEGGCFAPAMRKIAECYFSGEGGVTLSSTTGMAWLQAAHSLGQDPEAAHLVAVNYEYGHHNVEVDVVAAAQWFEKAATAGYVEAMAELALCYELGCGVEQSDEQALDWYTKAANEGHITSKFSVGEAFEEARGVPQSDEEACIWYYRAALMGDEDSLKALRRLHDIARIVVPGVASLLRD